MKTGRIAMALALAGLAAGSLSAQEEKGPPPPPDQGQGGPGGHPPGGFHLLPPFAMDKLNLTEDQQKQIADLEKETKEKLDKILTPEQIKMLSEMRPPRPPGEGGRGGDRRSGSRSRGEGDQTKRQRPPSE